MSSKLVQPDQPGGEERVVWRRVDTGRGVANYLSVAAAAQAAVAPESGDSLNERVQDAHAAGLREGEAAGRACAAAELQPVVERLTRAIQELANWKPRLRREAEGDLLRLAVAMARRILRREIVLDPDAMHGLILGALEKLQSQEICRVRVHPAHAPLVTACLGQGTAGAAVEVLPDPSRELGTVIFETERGNLDASVESQLREIERGLADRLINRGLADCPNNQR